MSLHKAILLNLDTELDYYHSDGRTDFVGHRDTRTHIKDVSMGAGSSTSFGLQNLMVNCAGPGEPPIIALFCEDLQNLSIFSNMGKGLKKLEKKAKKARDVGKKYYPMADQAFAIVAPENHAKYAPKLEKGYKTFNTKANKMGGWNTVEKAADAMSSVGLVVLDGSTDRKCA